jgi:cysteine desulfurase
MNMIYLDHNATTRPTPEVVEAMARTLRSVWANPSSKHGLGQAARGVLTQARNDVAALLGARATEIVFTSGATEANHHALHGALARPGAPRRIAISAIEHAGYMKAVDGLRAQGIEVVILPVNPQGRLRLDALPELLSQPLALVSVMMANNETGVMQPIAALLNMTRTRNLPLHVDATQCAGKIPLNFDASGIDLMSLSAHKLHGPQGVGALLIRKGLEWPSLFPGQQERGRRGGTENLAGIVGFGVAARQAMHEMQAEQTRQRDLRLQLETALLNLAGVTIHGAEAERLPNTTSLRITGLHADRVLNHLDRLYIHAASGAACSASGNAPSHVMLAMGLCPEEAQETIRISIGRDTRESDIRALIAALTEIAPLHTAAGKAPHMTCAPQTIFSQDPAEVLLP